MDIPLHPLVVTEMARGREFLDRVRAARQTLAETQVSIPFPDQGGGEIVFNGEGMVIDADFPDDIFDRFPGEKLSDTLTAMCQEAYHQLSALAAETCTAASSPEDH